MSNTVNLDLLKVPCGPIDAVLDTDAFNETDDQFAITYLLNCGEKVNLRALYAAPFFNSNSTSPADGMEKSYQEILTLLTLTKREDMKEKTFRGSITYLPNEKTPVDSDAARHLVALSKEYSSEHPLYIVAIGAITNVASAILLDPTLAERSVVVWLGGHAQHWDHPTDEFNLVQDIAAARVVFDSGVALVQLPCGGVVTHFATSGPELDYWLKDKGSAVADFLVGRCYGEANKYAKDKVWTRVIWDVTAVAWLMNDDNRFMSGKIMPRPVITYDRQYAYSYHRQPMLYIDVINRDALMRDLFARILRS